MNNICGILTSIEIWLAMFSGPECQWKYIEKVPLPFEESTKYKYIAKLFELYSQIVYRRAQLS